MTAPTPTTDRITAAELREQHARVLDQLAAVRDAIADCRHAQADLSASIAALYAASQLIQDKLGMFAKPAVAPASTSPAPAATDNRQYVDFTAESLVVMTTDDGSPAYKVKGGRFSKFGVRVWPETLAALGLEAESLRPGPNAFAKVVRAVMGEKGPQKIIGLAPAQPGQYVKPEAAPF